MSLHHSIAITVCLLKEENGVTKYYKKVGIDTDKYGYRNAFDWELEKWEKELKQNYRSASKPSKVYGYILKSGDKLEQKLKSILEEINRNDQEQVPGKVIDLVEGQKLHRQEDIDGHRKTHEGQGTIIQSGQRIEKKLEGIKQTLLGRQQAKEKLQMWFDVREPVQSFTALSPGRQDTLDQIASSIQEGIVVISGLGGVGKSQLAMKYARDHYSQQDSVIWINAEARQTMEDSFHRLYKRLGFKIKDDENGEDKDIKSIVKDIYEHFADGKGLFIFDNAEEPDSVSEVLQPSFELAPEDNKPHILITSRYKEWKNVKVLELGELKKEEAVKFIKDYLKLEGTSQDEDIKELASTIQCFPLALQQAVAYIEDEKIINKGFGIKDYLRIYKNSKEGLRELLSSDTFRSVDNTYKDTVLTTWKVTLNKIESDSQYGKKALEILNIMSYLVPDNISREVFSKLTNDDKELGSAVRLLVKYSMINSIEEGQEVLSIHRLVQQVTRLNLEKEKKEEEFIKKTLELINGADVVENNLDHVTSVWKYASKYDKLIEEFIINSIDANVSDRMTTPLYLLAGDGYVEAIRSILKYVRENHNGKLNGIVNFPNKNDNIPLHIAASNGYKDIVEFLVNNDANVNAINKFDNTPLHRAVENNHFEAVEYLAGKVANLNAVNKKGNTPLHLAARNGYLKNGYPKIVDVLLEKKADLDAKTQHQFTPLHLAAQNGHSEVVSILLKRGADVNAETQHQFTPLHLAVQKGHLNVVNILLEDSKVTVDAKTKQDSTPLHLAAKIGNLGIVEALLKKGANVNAQQKDGFTPLHSAVLSNHINTVNYLLKEKNININLQTIKDDVLNNTPLHIAAEKGYLDIVEVLIANGAKVDIENKEGKKPLDLAVEKGYSEVESYIIEHSKNSVISSKVEQGQKTTFNKRQGTAGASGQFYEIKLSMLFLLQGVTKKADGKINSFHLASNINEADNLDDVVFKYKYKDQDGEEKSKTVFLQAKHKETVEDSEKKVTIKKLLSDSDADFSLQKYFTSYLKIKQQFSQKKADEPIFGSRFEDCDFIIYTNALPGFSINKGGVEKLEKSIEKINVDKDSILNLSEEEAPEGNSYYKLIFGKDKDKEIVDALQYSSDCNKLARELARSAFSQDGININKPVFQDYLIPLKEGVLEMKKPKEGKFRDSFLDGDESLSTDGSKFRSIFFKEVEKISKKSEDELKSGLRSKSIKISDKFWNVEQSENRKLSLPSDYVGEDDIKEFLSKLKLFVNQPNEGKLDEIIKQKIQLAYQVEQDDVNTIFSDVKNKVERWWKVGNDYLTENNRFFQDSVRISILFDVKKPVDLFTGRKRELSNLHNKIQRGSERVTVISQMTSVSGLGGIGKTELARQYVHEHSQDYDNNIIWVNAESEATLIESFRRLAQDKLRISTKNVDGNEKDIKSIVEEVYKFFAKRKSLFVFDNAEKSEGFNQFLPRSALSTGDNVPYILVTSRNQEWERGIEVLNLNELKLEDAIEFVKKGLSIPKEDISQDKEIEKLVKKLQCFPLAIQQAMAYIEDQRVMEEFGIDDYLKEYEKKAEDLLKSEVFRGIDNDYAKTTFTTWQITIDKIKGDKQHGELALKILDAIAYFAPENITREMFLNLAGGNEEQLKSAVRLLVKYSMISGEQKQSVLSIHRLVQEVTRLELKGQGKKEESLKIALKLIEKNVRKENLDHAVSAWNYASEHKELAKEFSALPSKIISELDDTIRYKEAALFGRKALESLESILGAYHSDTLTMKDYMARILFKQGKYEEAYNMWKENREKREKIYEKSKEELDYKKILEDKNGEASALDALHRYEEASEIKREVYEKRKKMLGVDHPDTLQAMNNMAGTSFNQGNYEEAYNIWSEVFKKQKMVLESDNPDTLITRSNMAAALSRQNKFPEALQIYQEAYKKREKKLGQYHLDTLTTKGDMAQILFNQGEYEEAYTICKEVYEKMKEKLGQDHPKALTIRDNMMQILFKQGKYEEAYTICKEVYEERERKLGSNHLEALRARHQMAIALNEHGKHTKNSVLLDQALQIHQEILRERKGILGSDHLDTLETMFHMAGTLYNQGEYAKAYTIWKEVYEKRKEKLGPDHSDTLQAKQNMMLALERHGKELVECLPDPSSGNRRKREAPKCELSWEDVDEFNEEKEGVRDFSKIKINSNRFIDYIKSESMSETKLAKLVQLAEKVQVTGKFQGLVNTLISNQKVMNHLNRVGRVSGIAMHGMMAKNIVADFLNGDYEGVAINVGFFALPLVVKAGETVSLQGLELAEEFALAKGIRLASVAKPLFAQSIKVSSSFFARGTSAFIAYDLYNQVQAYKNGTKDALVGIVGDSIILGVDVAEFGIKIAGIRSEVWFKRQ